VRLPRDFPILDQKPSTLRHRTDTNETGQFDATYTVPRTFAKYSDALRRFAVPVKRWEKVWFALDFNSSSG
jgi:hypothetical protein